MAAVQFRIGFNSAAFAEKLQKVGKFAIPVAVQQTLTSAAFRTKKETLPIEEQVFLHRKPTFFKANSKAVAAKGLNIDTMKSTVGFVPKANDRSHSVEDLQEQEDGGAIGNRSFIPLTMARTGNVWQGLTRKKNRMEEFKKKIFHPDDVPGTVNRTYGASAPSDKERFVLSAIEAAKVGGLVIGNKINPKANKMVYRVDHINRFGGETHFVTTPLFALKKDREVHPKATHFMRKASEESQLKMEADFAKFAGIQIAKIK